jgi:hypothetical protein
MRELLNSDSTGTIGGVYKFVGESGDGFIKNEIYILT